jgi:type I restriction enzyme, S subunit
VKPYPKYKPSGFEWLGDVPEKCEVRRYKHFYPSGMGATILNENLVLGGQLPVFSATEGDEVFGYVDSSRVLLDSGDIVIPARGNSIGHVMLVRGPATCTQTTIYSKPISKGIIPEFVSYFLKGLRKELFQFDRTAIPQITVEQVRENPLLVPSLSEQQSIIRFLDDKTAKIDTLIEKKRLHIALLTEERQAVINRAVTKGLNQNAKMKPSGIEWLGDVPEGWEVKKLKYILTLQSGDGISPDVIKESDDFPVYGGNGVMGYTSAFNSDAEDIIVGRVGAKCGNVHFVKGKKWISDNALHLSTTEEGEYVALLLDSMNLNRLANQNAQPLITGTLVKDQITAIPPRKEQMLIVQHIRTKTNEIATLIEKSERAIMLLTEYRTALIMEAVTGRVEITN